MNVNPLKTLDTFGQSLWLDYIRRDLITSGQLRRLIEQDGLQGMVGPLVVGDEYSIPAR
jgi:hypothetical protein